MFSLKEFFAYSRVPTQDVDVPEVLKACDQIIEKLQFSNTEPPPAKLSVEGENIEVGKFCINVVRDETHRVQLKFTEMMLYIEIYNDNKKIVFNDIPKGVSLVYHDVQEVAQRVFQTFLRFRFKTVEIGHGAFLNCARRACRRQVQCLRIPNWSSGQDVARKFNPVELIIGKLPYPEEEAMPEKVLNLSKLGALRQLHIQSATTINFAQFYRYKLEMLKITAYKKDTTFEDIESFHLERKKRGNKPMVQMYISDEVTKSSARNFIYEKEPGRVQNLRNTDGATSWRNLSCSFTDVL